MLALDAVSPIERIRLTADLSGSISRVSGATGLERVRIARRIGELLVLLTGDGHADDVVPKINGFSLADPKGSAVALADYLANGIAALPEPLRTYEADTVAVLAGSVKAMEVAGHGVAYSAQNGLHASYSDEARLAVFDLMKGRGVKVEIDADGVKARAAEVESILKSTVRSDPEWLRIDASIKSLNDGFRNAWAKADKRSDDAAEMYATYQRDFEELRKQADARAEAFKGEKSARAMALVKDDGEKVIAAVLAASPVTEEEAMAWARKQEIDANATARLSRLKYKKDQVIKDMAEFYRLTGGKASAVRIASDGGKRANAVGVHERLGEKVINLGSWFDKTVLFHELAHHLENDPIAQGAANGFLVKRRDSKSVRRLSEITGNRAYGFREVAYTDDFMDPYIGKVYSDGVTEVFSMGVQYLADPMNAALLAAKDPEMFALISGYLTSPLTAGMAAKLHMHEGSATEIVAARKTEETAFAQSVTQLAAMVTLVDDGWYTAERAQERSDWKWRMAADGPVKYVGVHGEYRVFEGKLRNRSTGRKSLGYFVARLDGSDNWEYATVHGGVDVARALIAIAKATGIGITKAYWDYIHTDKNRKTGNRKKVIGLVESIRSQP